MAVQDERTAAVRPAPARAITHVSTRDLSPGADVPRRSPERRVRTVVPARLRIMAWLVLLLATALLTVVVVTRNLLTAEARADAVSALEQEAGEFRRFADAGVDRQTGAPYENGEDLLRRHLSRQFLDDNEIMLGVTASGEIIPQLGNQDVVEIANRDNRLRQILDSPRTADVLTTRDGRVRWMKVPVVDRDGTPDGTFVVAYSVNGETREVDEAVRTLAVVSGVGLLLAAAAAWVVSGQILEPVNAVRRTAARISHDDLTERIAVVGRDDIAALSDQFNGMLDRLEQAFRAQRQFLDDASHELRTPITIIRGNLEFVADDDPEERAEVVRLCTDELDRMSRIVEDLLLLAKAERPDFVRPEDVGLVDLTSDVDAKLRALGDRRWELEAIAEGEGLLDPQRVTQALVQLAHNAVNHTRPGDVIRLGSARGEREVRFWIADTGVGVRPEDAEAIFSRFSRGSSGGARGNATGAGLGLTIVTAIAEAHGGHVELRSVPGEGATFSLHLPQPEGFHESLGDDDPGDDDRRDATA